MNKDLLFDAMEYIDEEMLEDVNVLRSRKAAKPNRTWMRYASIAACACIILSGVFAVSRLGLHDSAEEADGLMNETMSENTGHMDETGASSSETMAQEENSNDSEMNIPSFPDSLDYSGLDVSTVKSIRLTCGYNGETVWLTDPEDIREITDCVLQIRGDNPESSRGYYGWSYGIYLYKEENPSDDTTPMWYGGMFWGKMYSNYTYETVKGLSYAALYRMTGITTEEIDAVCEKHFPSLADFSGMNSP